MLNKIKYLFFLLAFLLMIGCAGSKKSEVQFVPLQISWETLDELSTDDELVSKCMVRLTNSIMENSEVQKEASSSEFSYLATISKTSENKDSQSLSFEGKCSLEAVVTNKTLCHWKALCDSSGSVLLEFVK